MPDIKLQTLTGFYESLILLFKAYPLLSMLSSFLYFVFSYTFGVHIKECVKERRAKSRARKEKLKLLEHARHLRSNQSGKNFSFGKISTSVYVLDYYQQGYSKDFLISKITNNNEVVPSRFQKEFNKNTEEWTKKRDSGEIFEGARKVAVKKISIERSPNDEAKRLRIELDSSKSYIYKMSATSVFLGLNDELRAEITSEPQKTMIPFFSNSFGILVAVITGDDQLVFVKRGGSTAVNESKIICGVVEGMIEKDIVNGRLDPVMAASRALSEELGINLDADELSSITITSCIFNSDYHEWNLVGYVDLRNFGSKYLSSVIHDYNSTAKAHDSWEVDELIFLDFEPKVIAGYLLAHEDEVVNYSIVTAIYALLAAYENRKEIAKAFDVNLDLTH